MLEYFIEYKIRKMKGRYPNIKKFLVILFAFLMIFSIPVFAEHENAIDLVTMLTDYEKHAKGIGILVDVGEKKVRGDGVAAMFYQNDDFISIVANWGVWMTNMSVANFENDDLLMLKEAALVASYVYHGTDKVLGWENIFDDIFPKLTSILLADQKTKIMLCDGYAAYFLPETKTVSIDYISEMP